MKFAFAIDLARIFSPKESLLATHDATAQIDALRGYKWSSTLTKRLLHAISVQQLGEILAVLAIKCDTITTFFCDVQLALRLSLFKTLTTLREILGISKRCPSPLIEPSYIRELESSRPYQTAARDYNPVEDVTREKIVFQSTDDAILQLPKDRNNPFGSEQACDDSPENPDVVAEDCSSSSTPGRNARSISSSFDDDTQTAGDEDSGKVIKDIVLYDEAGGTHQLVCLLDTGATIDCISKRKAREIRYDTWMRKLKAPIQVPVGGNQTTCVKYVVKAVWRFVDKTTLYRQKLYVTDLDNLPYDIILSRRTIFQFKFLVSSMDCYPSAHALDGVDALLPLGLTKLSRGTFPVTEVDYLP
jgi:hypothetical protein